MSKVTLPRFNSGFATNTKLNEAMALIETALDNTLSRDGTVPNQLTSDLDLNGQVLLNSGDSDDPNRVLSFTDMVDYVAGVAEGMVVQQQEIQTASASQTLFTLADVSYTPGANNLAVYVNGVRKFSPTDYTESSATEVTFLAGQTLGAQVQFVTNEFLGTITIQAHTHPWSQITNTPIYTTRWADWTEVTGKPVEFPPESHEHDAADITSGRLLDAQRGVWVQASQPSSPTLNDVWFW